RVTSSYGASGLSVADASTVMTSGSGCSTRAPTARSRSLITSRSATGGMLRRVVTPGASRAAAICFTPEFLVAPATSIRPSRRAPGRTRKRLIGSLPAVHRVARLDDRGDCLPHVVRLETHLLLLRFEDQSLFDRQATRCRHRALRTLHRER